MPEIIGLLKTVREIQHLVRKCSQKIHYDLILHITSYLSIGLSKILLHSKTVKKAKKLSVFGENDSHRFFYFFANSYFWIFNHISRIYNQINYRNIWFPKVMVILIMTAQVLFFNVFSEKDPHLNATEFPVNIYLLKVNNRSSRKRCEICSKS